MEFPYLGFPYSTGVLPSSGINSRLSRRNAATASEPCLPQARSTGSDSNNVPQPNELQGHEAAEDSHPQKKGRKKFWVPESFKRGMMRLFALTPATLDDIAVAVEREGGPKDQWVRDFYEEHTGMKAFSRLRFPRRGAAARRRRRGHEAARRAISQLPMEPANDNSTAPAPHEDALIDLGLESEDQDVVAPLGEPGRLPRQLNGFSALEIPQKISSSTSDLSLSRQKQSEELIANDEAPADVSMKRARTTSFLDNRPTPAHRNRIPSIPGRSRKRTRDSDDDYKRQGDSRTWAQRVQAASQLNNAGVGSNLDDVTGGSGYYSYIMDTLSIRALTIRSYLSSTASTTMSSSTTSWSVGSREARTRHAHLCRTDESDYLMYYHSPPFPPLPESAVAVVLNIRYHALTATDSRLRASSDDDARAWLTRLSKERGSEGMAWLKEKDERGVTVLHLAAAYGWPSTCSYMVHDVDADTTAISIRGDTIYEFTRPAQKLARDPKVYFLIMHCRQWLKHNMAPPISSAIRPIHSYSGRSRGLQHRVSHARTPTASSGGLQAIAPNAAGHTISSAVDELQHDAEHTSQYYPTRIESRQTGATMNPMHSFSQAVLQQSASNDRTQLTNFLPSMSSPLTVVPTYSQPYQGPSGIMAASAPCLPSFVASSTVSPAGDYDYRTMRNQQHGFSIHRSSQIFDPNASVSVPEYGIDAAWPVNTQAPTAGALDSPLSAPFPIPTSQDLVTQSPTTGAFLSKQNRKKTVQWEDHFLSGATLGSQAVSNAYPPSGPETSTAPDFSLKDTLPPRSIQQQGYVRSHIPINEYQQTMSIPISTEPIHHPSTTYAELTSAINPLPLVPDNSYSVATEAGGRQYQAFAQGFGENGGTTHPVVQLPPSQSQAIRSEPEQTTTETGHSMAAQMHPIVSTSNTSNGGLETSPMAIICPHGQWVGFSASLCHFCPSYNAAHGL